MAENCSVDHRFASVKRVRGDCSFWFPQDQYLLNRMVNVATRQLCNAMYATMFSLVLEVSGLAGRRRRYCVTVSLPPAYIGANVRCYPTPI